MIFDTHAHYDDRKFKADRHELLNSLKANGIGRVVNIGADIESTRRSIALAKEYDFIYAAAGVHPSDVDCLDDRTFQWLTWAVEESVEEKGKIVGISFSSQAGSIYPADENNKPLYNALTWMDRRAVAENEEKTAALGFANITDKSGWKPTPADCISKLLWLKRHEPEVFSNTKHFYTTLESVTGFLCGNFVTDPTNIALPRHRS